MTLQKITVHGKIKVEEFGSLKEFLFLEIPKLFYVHFEPGFLRAVQSTSFIQLKSESSERILKLQLNLNNNWISFRLEKPFLPDRSLVFVPHPSGDDNIERLCQFLNAFQTRLE